MTREAKTVPPEWGINLLEKCHPLGRDGLGDLNNRESPRSSAESKARFAECILSLQRDCRKLDGRAAVYALECTIQLQFTRHVGSEWGRKLFTVRLIKMGFFFICIVIKETELDDSFFLY